MKIKTNELKGLALNWAVAKALGLIDADMTECVVIDVNGRLFDMRTGKDYDPSTNWAHGGPIIAQEGITLSKTAHGFWEAYKRPAGVNECYQVSDDPLIAAMRCYVASKLGDEVDVPEELI
jgi:hypothetical protein